MNEEIEYAEMLEIPVSTVNVIKKKRGRKRKAEVKETPVAPAPNLKESVIAQVNGKMTEEPIVENEITAEAALFAESANSEGNLDFGEIPERIDTVRLYSAREKAFRKEIALTADDYAFETENLENDGGRYEINRETKSEKRVRLVLGAEFAVACALCGAIFLTNVFMPGSAVNTFFRALDGSAKTDTIDARTYADFTLSGVVNDFSDTELTLSPTGILSFTDECHVYPAANGTVSAVIENEDGTYTLKISHSDTFTGVIDGLDQVYYVEGEAVKTNVPVGYSYGEAEVQVTMYSSGALLNCFELTEENCLAWIEQE
ncbi:MAG: hypothetical protein J6B56_01130 [Clostridia bacterium]|nr:hypothetical protein [Clostridia bacterium]